MLSGYRPATRRPSPRVDVVGDHIAVIGEFLARTAHICRAARRTAIPQFPEFRAGPEFPIATGMMGIVDAPDTDLL